MKLISDYRLIHSVLFLLSKDENFDVRFFRRKTSCGVARTSPFTNQRDSRFAYDLYASSYDYLTSLQESIVPSKSIDQAIAWIDQYCDRQFLYAVVASDYHFLYRGITDTTVDLLVPLPSVQNDKPDLLKLETYGSSEALEFFQLLEDLFSLSGSMLRPSTGHLATTSIHDASKWGTYAASIWPISSRELSTSELDSAMKLPTHGQRSYSSKYAWFRDHGLFFPRSRDFQFSVQTDERKLAEKVSLRSLRRSIVIDGQSCEEAEGLAEALQSDACEVLFPANPFLAIPVSFDEVVRRQLKSSFVI